MVAPTVLGGVVGARIARPLLRRPLHRHLCRVQHILNENSVTRGGIVDENVCYRAHELAVLNDGGACHECGQ